jgi:hypothetical protein
MIAGHAPRLTARHDKENILRCILSQVAMSVDGTTVYDGVVKRFNQDHRRMLAGTGLTLTDCVQFLGAIFSSNKKTHYTILVDALDECADYDALLDSLKQAVGSNKNVRIAFTSRLQVKVEDSFPDVATLTIDTQNMDDIKSFLDIEIPKRRVGSGMTDAQEAKLRELLTEKATGM